MHFERQVKTVARKKIVFIIVEGPSDDEALEVLLSKIYDKNRVYVHITHGDITTSKGVNSTNILAKLGNMIKAYATANHFQKTVFREIVHIVDMDGAYVPDSAIVEDSSIQRPVYGLTEIRTNNVSGLIARNKTKSKCLDRISTTKSIWEIPYQVYYMSSNLDHVLYNEQNSTDEQKEKNALSFALKYKEDINGFIDFVENSSFSMMNGYIESWDFIKEGLHSLERHTNFGICLKRAVESNDQ